MITVTQGEFTSAMGAIKQDFDRIDQRFEEIDQRFQQVDMRLDTLETTQQKMLRILEATLTTVQSIDGRLADMSTHEERITRLENTVYAPN